MAKFMAAIANGGTFNGYELQHQLLQHVNQASSKS
jgi:hypothetical protein